MTPALSILDLLPDLGVTAAAIAQPLEPDESWLAVLLAALPVEWFPPPLAPPVEMEKTDAQSQMAQPAQVPTAQVPANLPIAIPIPVPLPLPVPEPAPKVDPTPPPPQRPLVDEIAPAPLPPPAVAPTEVFRLAAKWQPDPAPEPAPLPAAELTKPLPRSTILTLSAPPPPSPPPSFRLPLTVDGLRFTALPPVVMGKQPPELEKPASDVDAPPVLAPAHETERATPPPDIPRPALAVARPESEAPLPPKPEPRQETPRPARPARSVPEPAPPAPEKETTVGPKSPAAAAESRPSEAPAPEPAAPRSVALEVLHRLAADRPQPAELHGLERAIERAELHQSATTSEINLWMRPEHLGKVAVRLVERAGVVELAVRAEAPAARGWLAEGLPALVDSLRERGFEVNPAGPGSETALDWWARDQHPSRRQQPRDGQKRRHSSQFLFSLPSGEAS